nr:unnamed protein product [Callosobruchus chinensis]
MKMCSALPAPVTSLRTPLRSRLELDSARCVSKKTKRAQVRPSCPAHLPPPVLATNASPAWPRLIIPHLFIPTIASSPPHPYLRPHPPRTASSTTCTTSTCQTSSEGGRTATLTCPCGSRQSRLYGRILLRSAPPRGH